MYSNLKTYIILFIGVFALSTSAIFVKIADAPAPIIAFYRLLTAGVVLLPFFLCSRSCRSEFKALQPKQWGQIVAAGFCLALHYVMWFESLNYTSIASSTVLVSLQPLLSLAFERFFSRKKVAPSDLVGVA
ncbi:MAG: DMT family transporter, partial [Oscillospiraceae bacterium]|nr:DMT family transporter [Oscillospiraceae bacterium]